MAAIAPPGPALDALTAGFRGTLHGPDDPAYNELRRVHNAMIDRRPALIARCSGTADVMAALAYARDHHLPVAVRSGGHSVSGYGMCDEGVCIDVSPMKGIWVDPQRRVVRAQAGLTWGEFDRETALYGLATTGGRVSSTGIGGLILGSGSGWLERKHGLSADNLLAADVVTADGRLVRASADENPELFWGLRGGGGNFGIVTSFELRLHPLPPLILGGMLLWPFGRAREVVQFYREFMESAPDEVISAMAFITAPPEPFVPEPARGQKVVGVILGWAGDPDEGAEVITPLREFGPPAADLVGPMPYVALQQLIDPANQPGFHHYWKAENFRVFDDEVIEVFIERAAQVPSPFTEFLLVPCGGAVGRVPNDATALGNRDAKWQFHALSVWPDPADSEANIAWSRGTAEALKPYVGGGIYLNYTSDSDEAAILASYGQKYDRLVALKDEFDPNNVFRMNQNIKPSSS